MDASLASGVSTFAGGSSAVTGAAPTLSKVTITYYTDPLCSWSWAFEPQWRRLRDTFGERVERRYVMGGMIADWGSYADSLNTISTPVQMGPQWFQVREMTGMPLDERLWHDDPPASSYPACIAVKAAGQQGPAAEERYLRRVREAVMLERRNVARRETLLAVADELAVAMRDFDRERFIRDLDGAAPDALREDLKEASYHGIGRFPTLTFTRAGFRGVGITGYRPYAALSEAFTQVAPDLEPAWIAPDAVAFARRWDGATVPEAARALDLTVEAARAQLDAATERGGLERSAAGCYRERCYRER